MSVSSGTAAWIAVAAGGVAVIAFLLTFLCWRELRRVRAAQLVLLGGGKGDLVDFAVSLQGRIDDLHRAVDEIAAGLARVDRRVDESLSKTSIVRYDAYEGTGGQRHRPRRDSGPRLRAHLHEGARARPRLDRALARGRRSGRARDVAVAPSG